ncbi:hypothetical protein LQW54_000710 [Pestalotiopsis sp. IQ-011]
MTISLGISDVSILQKLAWRCEYANGNGFVTIDKADHDSFFKAIAFAIHGLIGSMEPLSTSCIECKPCEACSPSTPAVHWVSKSDESNFVPIHMVEDVGRYESALRKQESALKVMAKVLPDQAHVESSSVCVKLTVNPSRLAHRALSYLPSKLSGRAGPVRLEAFIEPGHSDSLVFNLKPFSASITKPAPLPGAGPISQPPHFRTGKLLDPKQLVTVDYMIRREKSPALFIEREDEEEVLKGLPLRVVGRAMRDVSCGGGIIADKVGAGKTVMSLALISCQTEFDQAGYARRVEREAEDGTKALQATLIIVPKHIITQWASEIAMFLPGLRKSVIALETVKDLFTIDLEALSDAKIVIASDSLWRENSYREELARFAAKPSITKPYRQRPYREWYNTSVQALRGFLGQYLQPGASQDDDLDLASAINDEYYQWQEQNHEWVNGIVQPGGRKIAKGKKAPAKKTSVKLKQRVDMDPYMFFDHKPILEHFSFARIVWDEVSYENLEVGQFMSIAMAEHKWLLSGTPPRQTLDDIASLAQALGISLARTVDLRAGLPSITNFPTETDRTETETCMSYGRLKSDRFVKDRHEQAERFLRTFSVSSEAAELQIQTHEHAIICAPTPMEKSIYLERQQVWRCAQMNVDFLDKDILHEMLRTIGHPRATAAPHDLSALTLSYAASLPTFRQDDDFSLATVAQDRRKVLDGTVKYLVQLIDQLLWLAHRLEKLAPAKPKTEKAKDADGESGGVDTFRLYLYRLGRFQHQFFGGKSVHLAILKALAEDPNSLGGDLGSHVEKAGVDLASLSSNKLKAGPLGVEEDYLKKLFDARNISWKKFYRVEKDLVAKLDRVNLIELLEELTSLNLHSMDDQELRVELLKHLDEIIPEQDEFRSSHAIPDADKQQVPLRLKTKGDLSTLARMRGLKCSPSMRKEDIMYMIELHDKGGAGYSNYLMGTDIRALVAAEPPPMMGTNVRKRGANHSETENKFKELWNLFLNALLVLIVHNDSVNRTEMFAAFTQNGEFRCEKCQGDTMLKVNLLCGHVFCEDHLQEPCGDGYDGSGCQSPVDGNVVDTKDLSAAPRSLQIQNIVPQRAQSESRSSKVKCIIDLIHQIPQDDKIIVFTQHEGMIHTLDKFMRYEGIIARTTLLGLHHSRPVYPTAKESAALALRTANKAGTNVEDFKKGKYRVLVLKVDAAEAAGSNLTIANHVIFATPLAVSAQDKYESYMEQAKGRCARRGQKQDVHFYHCAVEDTVEVDMIEARTKKHIRVQPGRSLGWLVPRGMTEAELSLKPDYSPRHSESERVNSILNQNEIWKALGEVDHAVIRGFTDTSYVKEAKVDFSNLAIRTKNKGSEITEAAEMQDDVALSSIVKEEESHSDENMDGFDDPHADIYD